MKKKKGKILPTGRNWPADLDGLPPGISTAAPCSLIVQSNANPPPRCAVSIAFTASVREREGV